MFDFFKRRKQAERELEITQEWLDEFQGVAGQLFVDNWLLERRVLLLEDFVYKLKSKEAKAFIARYEEEKNTARADLEKEDDNVEA